MGMSEQKRTVWHGQMPAFQVQNPSKQHKRAVIQFLHAEGCQPAKIRERMQVVHGNAQVLKIVVMGWHQNSVQGGRE
jgi:hypothetical protein